MQLFRRGVSLFVRSVRADGWRGLFSFLRRGFQVARRWRLFTAQQRRREREDRAYSAWFDARRPDEAERRRQAETRFSHRVSFLIPTWNTRPEYLRALADSLLRQTSPCWEACFYDGASENAETRRLLAALPAEDSRFRVRLGEENLRISGNTNLAAGMATSDWFALCDHDDLLAEEAVYRVLEAAEAGADFVYTDEDKVTADGTALFEPHFKPDFAPDSLRSGNYICHLMAMRAALYREVGGLRGEYDGSQDHDLALRATERAGKIVHVRQVLYHWRMVETSFSHTRAEKCVDAAMRAVQAQLDRLGEPGRAGMRSLTVRVSYPLPEGASVSLVVWGEEKPSGRWLRQLMKKTDLRFDSVAFAGKDDTGLAAAARESGSDYLCFLRAGLLPEEKSWASELLRHAARERVAFAGGPVLDQKGCYLNDGEAIGKGGAPVYRYRGELAEGRTWQLGDKLVQNVTGVPRACAMVSREKWLRLGGGADFLRMGAAAQAAGLRCVMVPWAAVAGRAFPQPAEHADGEERCWSPLWAEAFGEEAGQ